MALRRGPPDIAHRRRPRSGRFEAGRDRSHRVLSTPALDDARHAHCAQRRARLPPAGWIGRVASLLFRSEWRACRARFSRRRSTEGLMAVAVLDHLVVAAATLEQGEQYIETRLGVRPVRGGKHVAMGTHNSLLRLGPKIYLEVIAIDPDGIAPPRARWFGLDTAALRAELQTAPRLIHWIARTDDIAAARRACPVDCGEIQA